MSRPLRSGRAPRPGPDSDGQDATLTSPSPIRPGPVPGPGSGGPGPPWPCLSPHTAQRHGVQQAQRSLRPRASSRKGNCGRAMAAPSRCRHVPPGCHIDRWARIGTGPTSRSTSPSSDRLPHGSTSPSSNTRANPRLGRPQRRWGGSTPNHPAALQSGMQMGSESPEQHEYLSTRSVMLRSKTITRHARRRKLG